MVPDLQDFIQQYLKQKQENAKKNKYPADILMENLLLRPSNAPTGNWMYRIYDNLKDFHSHKWMYDEESLKGRLEKAGFCEVSKKSVYESRISDIRVVELNHGLCVEGIKPVVR